MFILTSLLLATAVGLAAKRADTILVNGRIFTGMPGKWAAALAISGTRIEAIGSSEQIRALAGPGTRILDVAGRLVLPGLNDAHVHFGPLDGERISIVAPSDASAFAKPVAPTVAKEPNCEAVLSAVRKAAGEKPKGKPLLVRIDSRAFFAPECTATALDQLAPDRPVLLRTFTSHAAIVNRSAARYLHVDPNEPPVLGGFFGKDMNSQHWDGVVHEYENFRLTEKLAIYDERELRAFFAQMAQLGITSIQVMSWNPAALIKLLDSIDAGVRVRVIPWPIPKGRSLPAVESFSIPRRIAERVSVSGFKIAIDGSFIEHSAATRAAYPDDPENHGKLNFLPTELKAMFLDARKRKQQLVLHICGDRAIDAVLTVLEDSGGRATWSDQRIRFEHANQLGPDHLARAKALGIVAVMNPPHLMMGDKQIVRSVAEAGIPLVFASDNALNPFLNLTYATAYPRNPREAVTMEQAVIAYTSLPAYSEFAENDKGTLEAGKLADITVLSANIFEVSSTDLAKTESLLTIVGGNIIHAKPPFELH